MDANKVSFWIKTVLVITVVVLVFVSTFSPEAIPWMTKKLSDATVSDIYMIALVHVIFTMK